VVARVISVTSILHPIRREPEVFRSFWHGEELTPLAWLCLSSFVRHRHRVELYTYGRIETPAGVELKDAEAILSRDRLFKLHDSYSPFSNLFRYALLERKGGWWIDTDVLCLGRRAPRGVIVFAEQEPGVINGGQMKFPPHHPVLHDLLSEFGKIPLAESKWGDTGPFLMTRVLEKHGLRRHAAPRAALYPLHWLETYKLWLPEFREEVLRRTSRSGFLHMWGAMHHAFGLDPRQWRPSPGSFLDRHYCAHGIYDRFALSSGDEAEVGRRISRYLAQQWVIAHAHKQRVVISLPMAAGPAG
jgi:hypothetical protein